MEIMIKLGILQQTGNTEYNCEDTLIKKVLSYFEYLQIMQIATY